MTKFVVIYYAPAAAMETKKDANPEDMKKGMEAWKAWAGKIGSGLLDWGSPLGNGQKVTKSGSSPSNKNVVGYSLLQADNMDAAKELLNEHPHLGWAEGCEIEVHECLPMPE